MAKKKIKEMTEEGWEKWGKNFGKKMEKKGEKLGEELEERGESFEKEFEPKVKKIEFRWSNRLGFFSFAGPLIGSVFGIIFLIITIFILNVVNIFIGSTFITALTDFFGSNLHWFFIVSLVLGYAKFITKKIRLTYHIISPAIKSASFVFSLWILGNILLAANVSAQINLLNNITNLLLTNLVNIFVVLLVFSYAMKTFWFLMGEIYI